MIFLLQLDLSPNNNYLWDKQDLFRWSNILMTGPHLSGLLFFGHRVTVGNSASLTGKTNVFAFVGNSSQARLKVKEIKNVLQKYDNYCQKYSIVDQFTARDFTVYWVLRTFVKKILQFAAFLISWTAYTIAPMKIKAHMVLFKVDNFDWAINFSPWILVPSANSFKVFRISIVQNWK